MFPNHDLTLRLRVLGMFIMIALSKSKECLDKNLAISDCDRDTAVPQWSCMEKPDENNTDFCDQSNAFSKINLHHCCKCYKNDIHSALKG